MRITRWLDELAHDVTFAVRQLRGAPAFTVIAVATLALGIGVNSAIFALVDATLLRSLPFPDPERLVMISERSETSPRSRVSPLNLIDWAARNHTFDAMAGFMPGVGGMVMNGRDGTSETVSRQWVTAGFFDVLRITPIAGRTFESSDDSLRASVVVLSEAFWRTRFGGDPAVVGREIRLDGALYTVVGVVPADFQLLGRTSMWALMPITGAPAAARRVYVLQGIGRRATGVAFSAATTDLAAVAEGLAREFPDTNRGRSVALEPMHSALIGGELRATSMLFLGVVGVVLLICCANVANLFMARATARTRELAIRFALGARRRRVVRQLLTESLVLSVLGGALGAGVGWTILSIAPSVMPQGLLPEAVNLNFDARVVAFCATTAVLVGLLFGLAPAWQATELAAAQAMGADGRSTTSRGGRLREGLVVGEVASAVLLLVGAGLLLRTLIAVNDADRGYRADSVLTMMVDPLGSRYPIAEALLQFFKAIEAEVTALPGVGRVAWTSAVPLSPSDAAESSFEIVGDPPIDASRRPAASYQIVSPRYFEALALPLLAGRGFDDRDSVNAVPVCVVNEAFVRRHLRGRSPMGVRIALRATESPLAAPAVREIVGVARQVKGRPDETEELVQIYVPLAQDLLDDVYLLVRPTSGRADALASSVRAAIGRVDKEQLVSVRDIMTLEDVARDATARHRFRAVLVGGFAGLALLLAMAGVFGLLAYSVQLRVREFALRRALGATTGDILRVVVTTAIRTTAGGVLIGLALSILLGRLLESVLFGVRPLDPVTFGWVIGTLVLAAGLSVLGPLWQAARIDPAVELRNG